ncbi:hypothetical protein FLGE108171_11450 [Flavobacterium gelidilacus]|uniref:hypothetical protein n=1 Tax=Flavobacterium gelidilacus TaxID=206041 RepID=UPI0012F8B907|nr:hypothetical protein [Flavobacterium gelidilacus]
MKKALLLFLIIPFMAFQCEPGEPCEPAIKQKSKPNLITVENLQTNYIVGDIIWLNSSLEKNQLFENPNETIDLLSYPLDYALGFQFYKSSLYSTDTYLCIDESSSEVTIGSNNNCNTFVYEKDGDFLKSRVGIKLLETGNFKIILSSISTFRETGLNCGDNALDIYTTFSNNNQNSITFIVQ